MTYGIDSYPTDHDDDSEEDRVIVPQVVIPLSARSLQQLNQIDPLRQCNDHGKEIYTETVQLLCQLMIEDELI